MFVVLAIRKQPKSGTSRGSAFIPEMPFHLVPLFYNVLKGFFEIISAHSCIVFLMKFLICHWKINTTTNDIWATSIKLFRVHF